MSNTQMGELHLGNLVGYMLTVVFAGVLAARFGPRGVIAVALLITGLGMTLTGVVPDFAGRGGGGF